MVMDEKDRDAHQHWAQIGKKHEGDFGEKIRKAATRYTQKASESTRQRKGTANHRPFRIGVRKAKRARRCTKGIRL